MKAFLYYFVSSIFPKLAGFLFAMLYAQILSPVEFGKLSLWIGWSSFVSVIIAFTFPQSYARNRLDPDNHLESFFHVGLFTGLGLSGFMEVLWLFFGPSFMDFLQIDLTGIHLGVFSGLMLFSINMYLTKYVVNGEPKKHLKLSVFAKVIPFLIFFIMLAVLSSHNNLLRLRYYAEISLLIIPIVLVKKEKLRIKPILDQFRSVFRYNNPFLVAVYPTVLMGLFITHIDKVFLANNSFNEELGSYSLTYNFVLAFAAIGGAVRMALERDYYSEADPANDNMYKRKVKGLNLLMSLGLGVALLFLAPVINSFFGGKYQFHNFVFYMLLSAAYFDYIFGLIIRVFLLKRQHTWVIPLVTSISLISNVVGNFILVPVYNQIGAATATLFASIVLLILASVFTVAKFGFRPLILLQGSEIGLMTAIICVIYLILNV